MKYLLGTLLITALGIAAFWLFVAPPRQLDYLDRFWPHYGPGGMAVLTGDGIAFGAHGQRLDIWNDKSQNRGAALPGGATKPVIIFYYGGGWVKGERADYGWAARALAAQGFVVVVPDYRKVPAVVFPDFVNDGADAVRWTQDNIAKFGGDPERIAIMGHSAGAHSVAMLTLDPRFLSTAGARPDAIKAAVGLSGPYDFYPYTGRAIEAMGKWPKPSDTQPISFANMDHARTQAPPLLLVTGTKDIVVRPRNAHNLAAAITTAGGQAMLKEYAGQGHEDIIMAFSLPFRGKSSVLADSVAFIQNSMESPK